MFFRIFSTLNPNASLQIHEQTPDGRRRLYAERRISVDRHQMGEYDVVKI